MMKQSTVTRRRLAVQISLARASRLHRLVTIIAAGPRTREQLLRDLKIGLRTFYRELELLRRCGVRVRLVSKEYRLAGSVAEAETRLPFPDPQLSFAEMAELARCPGDSGQRLGALLESVVGPPASPEPRGRRDTAAPAGTPRSRTRRKS